MKNILMISLLILGLLLFYGFINKSAAVFVSGGNSSVSANVANWDIAINENSIINENNTITLNDIVWEENSTVSAGYVAPGSKGIATLNINANNSDVAVLYTISYVDKSVEIDNVFTVTNVNGSGLIQTGINEYTGVITLEEIENETVETLSLQIEWIDNELYDEYDTSIGLNEAVKDFITINLHAIQYTGEEIVAYVGEVNEEV